MDGLPQWLSRKDTGATGDAGSIPGWGRSPGGGHGHPLQYSCLENLIDRGAWRAIQNHKVGDYTQLLC